MKQVLVMAKIGRPIKFVIRLTPEERTWLEGMIHCGIGLIRRCYGEANHLKGCAWNIWEKGRTPCIKRHSN